MFVLLANGYEDAVAAVLFVLRRLLTTLLGASCASRRDDTAMFGDRGKGKDLQDNDRHCFVRPTCSKLNTLFAQLKRIPDE